MGATLIVAATNVAVSGFVPVRSSIHVRGQEDSESGKSVEELHV